MVYFNKCLICLNYCNTSYKLNDCECKYTVHLKCYHKWWKENHTCIICRKPTKDPLKYGNERIEMRQVNLLIFISIVILSLVYPITKLIIFLNKN